MSNIPSIETGADVVTSLYTEWVQDMIQVVEMIKEENPEEYKTFMARRHDASKEGREKYIAGLLDYLRALEVNTEYIEERLKKENITLDQQDKIDCWNHLQQYAKVKELETFMASKFCDTGISGKLIQLCIEYIIKIWHFLLARETQPEVQILMQKFIAFTLDIKCKSPKDFNSLYEEIGKHQLQDTFSQILCNTLKPFHKFYHPMILMPAIEFKKVVDSDLQAEMKNLPEWITQQEFEVLLLELTKEGMDEWLKIWAGVEEKLQKSLA